MYNLNDYRRIVYYNDRLFKEAVGYRQQIPLIALSVGLTLGIMSESPYDWLSIAVTTALQSVA